MAGPPLVGRLGLRIYHLILKIEGWDTQYVTIQVDAYRHRSREIQNPCGSSTGSAVGVSAGYSPIALGTDSIGSLISPATRAALYTLKPTPGSVDMSGIYPVSVHFDAVGGMAKSVIDLAVITDSLLEPKSRESYKSEKFVDCLPKTFRGLKIGFLDPRVWQYPSALVKKIEEVDRQIVSLLYQVSGSLYLKIRFRSKPSMMQSQPSAITKLLMWNTRSQYLLSLLSNARDVVQQRRQRVGSETRLVSS